MSNGSLPLVSVIIPTYNNSQYVRQAIDSVLGQSYDSYEVIVVDDGSTDDTRTVLQSYDDRVHYIYQNNEGSASARNNGLQAAKGEFIVFLDSDDYVLPHKLTEQVAFLKALPALGLVHSGWRMVNDKGETTDVIEPWHDAPHLDLETWLKWKPVFMGAMMFRHIWLKRSNGFDASLRQAHDVDLILRLSLMGCKANWQRKATVCYRQHEGNITKNSLQQAKCLEIIMEKFFNLPGIPDNVRQIENSVRYYTIMWAASQLYRSGHISDAVKFLRKTFKYTTLSPDAAILDWLEHFSKWSSDESIEIKDLQLMLSHFKNATTKTLPLVSVVIPTYNNGKFIRQAVDSVLNQTYTECEIIVVDDGSTDDTRQVLQHYKDRIKYMHQENKGVSAARNRGTKLANGAFIVFLDADDYLLTDKIMKQLAGFNSNSDLGIVHSGWCVVDHNGNKLTDAKPWLNAPCLDMESWLLWKPVFLGAMMFRKELLERTEGFDIKLRHAEDVDLLFRLSLTGCKADWLYESTVCYRQHEKSTMQNGLQQAEDINTVLDNFFKRTDLPIKIRKMENRVRYYTLLWVVWNLKCTGHTDSIAQYLQKTLAYSIYTTPQTIFNWVGEYAKQFYKEGKDISELRSMLPHFKAAVNFDDKVWMQTAKMLDWWIDVWWYYLNKDYLMASQGLDAYRDCRTRELVKLAQSSLLMSPLPDTVLLVNQFWHDVIEKQIVPENERYEVTALYLTSFGQTLFAHHWSVALQALKMSIRNGLHPGAFSAWYRFIKAGFIYLCGRPGKKKISLS